MKYKRVKTKNIGQYIKKGGLPTGLIKDKRLLLSKTKERIGKHEKRLKIIQEDYKRTTKDMDNARKKQPPLFRFLLYDPIIAGGSGVLIDLHEKKRKLVKELDNLKEIVTVLK